ncbi:DJ-1/PfpI family protein [Arthrobacter psychrochitiniphilus]|uniref:DJ-1/PfpI family protein n=2 Tax=Arthrobacter TaxID=1663 RepID=A0A2V3DQ81_9MICC|nr:DJ-1/PfpI family protein [Arthrobacter psychrochitiniphilus]
MRSISVVLFDGFELLDVFGPVELLSRLPEVFSVTLIGPTAGLVRSSQGTEIVATVGYADAVTPQIVMVPGGMGTRRLAEDAEFLAWLASWSAGAELVTSVCTGSALLAAAGLLDGYRATSNKLAFAWASGHGRDVTWVPQARWVEDRTRWTSSGVAAGMDMTAALITALVGSQAATDVARQIELEVHPDPDWDPFAQQYGLI